VKERIFGSGGVGVAERSSSPDDFDDMFTDEQPSKDDISRHKAKEMPLLMDAWGEYGENKLVGNGQPTDEKCGTFSGFKGCIRVDLHDIITVDGQNFKNKAYVRRGFHWCHKPECPICFKHGWAVREAGNIEARLEEASKTLGQVEHITISVNPKHYGLPYKRIRKMASDAMLKRGIVGGVLIFHAFRYQKFRGWYFSPHFHVLGFILGGYSRCRNCKNKICIRTSGGDNFDKCDGYDARQRKFFKQDGFITKVLGKRKTVFGTAWYQLNHASYRTSGKGKRHIVATWFGLCSYRKLHFTPEKRVELCPICNHELKHLKFLGGEGIIVKHRDDPDFTLDSYEDYADSSGEPLWAEAPRKRKRYNVTPEPFFSKEDIEEIKRDWEVRKVGDRFVEGVKRGRGSLDKFVEDEGDFDIDSIFPDAETGFEKWKAKSGRGIHGV
jgi:hypothetical protein